MKYLLAAAALAFVLLPSCRKCDDGPVSSYPPDTKVYDQLWDCYNTGRYDSAKLATAMLGQWKNIWFESGGRRHDADSDLRVTFLPDGRYSMMVNVRPMSAGTWSLIPATPGFFSLNMDDTLHGFGGIPGRILVCDKQLYFNDAYKDGTNFGNTYYIRVQ